MVYGVFGLLFGSLGAAIPVGFALMTAGAVGILSVEGWTGLVGILSYLPFKQLCNFVFAAVPLFLFMAEIISATGIGSALFDTAEKWLRGFPAGICIASVVACTIFAAICGIPIAGTLALGLIAIPEMRRRGYDTKLAIGSIGAGGALASLIPPSVPLVVYGFMTNQSIGKLFMASFLPGVLLSAIFCTYITVLALLRPKVAPPIKEKISFKEKVATLPKMLPITLLIIAVLGGIYTGFATPTEAAGIGALLSALIAAPELKGRFPSVMWHAAATTARTTAFCGFIIIGATTFSIYLTLQGLPEAAVRTITSLNLHPMVVFLVLQVVYLVLGCFLDMISMMLITLPVVFPIIVGLGFDPIYFGAILMVNFETAVLTPPFGFNLFILQGIVPDVPYGDILRGVSPFIMLQILGLAILIAFPQIVMVLPNMMIK